MPATAFEFPAGLPWLNAVNPLTSAALSGRVTVLHFFACGQIAALDPLADLSGPAERLGARLAVAGVHCPQFPAERDREHLRQNLFRLGYRLPVVHDRDCAVARACAITGLPALVVLGPDGSIKARAEGAGAGAELAATVEALAAGLAEPAPLPVSLEEDVTDPGLISFPEGLLGLSAQELYLADTGNHRLLGVNVDRPSLRGLVAVTAGGCRPGHVDGDFSTARFNRPMGLCLGPDGRSLLVADAGNHCLRRVDLIDKIVETMAGPWRTPVPAWPTDVALVRGRPVLTLAGRGQVAELGADGRFAVLAEGLVEPRALAARGDNIFVADAGAGTILRLNAVNGVSTILAGPESLEHPQGLCLDPGGRELFIADTYHHKIARLDSEDRGFAVLAGKGRGSVDGMSARFFAPGAVSAAGGLVFAADTVNHHVRFVDLATGRTETLRLELA